MFPDSPSRQKIDLSGSWQYTIDGKEWSTVAVPSAYDFKNKVTFSRKFMVAAEMLDQYVFTLVAYGINHQSEISVNGNFIARHQGGHTSFVVQIPGNIIQVGGENSIRIGVDNELTPATTLPLRQQAGGPRSYGGIFRDIYLLATPKLYIESVDVASQNVTEGKTAKIPVTMEITDRGSEYKAEAGTTLGIQVEAFDKLTGEPAGKSGITQIVPSANKSVSAGVDVLIASPKLWSPSPDTSALYVFRCQLVRIVNKEASLVDEYSVDAGFRETKWSNGRLLVNGKVVPIKGIVWVEDHATFGSAMTYDAMERDIASMKTLGANTVRFLSPPHPYVLNLCDRYGLMVMEEIPFTGVPAEIMSRDYYQDLAAAYVKEMVSRDANHVCVLAWGIGDGFETGIPAACEYVNSMRNMVHAIDPRPVYFATRFVEDACFEYADIVAVNNDGRDAKEFREMMKAVRGKYPEKPVIVARYGREVEPNNRNGYSDPLSMEAQARGAMLIYDAIKETKIAGGILWSYSDWRTDRPSITTHSHDPYLKSMGIVSYEREKRTAFDVVRAMFNGEKAQALPIGNYSSSAPIIYVIAGLVALIALAFIYNGNRRFRDAVNRSMFRTYNFFADVRDQRILTYGHSIFLALIIAITWATLLSSIFTYYRNNVLLDNILNQLMSDRLKEWFVRLVWSPLEFIIVVAGILAAFLFFLSVAVRICSMTVKTRVYFYHAFSVTMWSLLPYIVLIPIVMLLYRLLDSSFYILPIFGFIGFITVWVLFRLLKGISIIFDVVPLKVYSIGLLLLVVLGAACYGYIDYTRSASVYMKYMIHTF